MDAIAFQLESPPATETRNQRARRSALNVIGERHAECRRVAGMEEDREAFEARREFFVTTGVDLAEVHDPAEGATLDKVLLELEERFRGKRGASRYWLGRDLCVWCNSRIVATISGECPNRCVVARHDREGTGGAAGNGIPVRDATPSLPRWIDARTAAEMVGGPDVLDAIGERIDLSVAPFYLTSEIIAIANQPKAEGPPRTRGGPKTYEAHRA